MLDLDASLTPLRFPDGSASYTSPTGDQILGSVNGPIESGRRDQRPEEATIEILVKPGVGVSGVGERYVEGILRGVLSRVILLREKSMPRAGIVITLVVLKNKWADGKVTERGGSVSATSNAKRQSIFRLYLSETRSPAAPLLVGPSLLTLCYEVSSDFTFVASYGSSCIALCCNPTLYDIHFCIDRSISDGRVGRQSLKLPHQNCEVITCPIIFV